MHCDQNSSRKYLLKWTQDLKPKVMQVFVGQCLGI